ncbi:Metallophosphoesterase [Sulfurimonas denitrificans DSM 1251]|uniref:Metallophosphoesterase n=1 Tax=Sulfurimonas denitrificans (strain ATCC 33889 / DSM 1251) TaxID=326298 RepID=Q30T49_SULDN|nr:metallophosphoesterase [Sulfurimonas denitrificans]ABB43832.1 Metallophosphoesterase [Sulfurimonas denitrificans DSM 1251]MDD3443064.1 metallophosphoesterase [Sulfurimonas denitrificans]
MNPLLFFIVFLSVFALINFYISRRFIAYLDVKATHKFYFHIFLFVNYLGIIGYMLGRYYLDFANWLYFLFSLPIGLLFLLFCTAIIYDISRVILKIAPLSAKRRNFFKRSLDLSSLLLASTLSAKSIYNARDIKLEKIDIKIKKLKKSYKIVQLSDIHIGGLIDKAFIKNLVLRVNDIRADLVVITGDLIDIKMDRGRDILAELKHLESAYGTFFVTGNHEYFHDIAKIIESLKELDIRVLENENIYIGDEGEGFNLAGVYDIFGYRTKSYVPDLSKALENLKNSPTILLAHQPKYIEEVTHSVDLMLSGHTHGGQLFPFRFLVKLQQPYISALHQHNKELQIYVNKGTGFWGPPMRLGACSEITEITLIPAL